MANKNLNYKYFKHHHQHLQLPNTLINTTTSSIPHHNVRDDHIYEEIMDEEQHQHQPEQEYYFKIDNDIIKTISPTSSIKSANSLTVSSESSSASSSSLNLSSTSIIMNENKSIKKVRFSKTDEANKQQQQQQSNLITFLTKIRGNNANIGAATNQRIILNSHSIDTSSIELKDLKQTTTGPALDQLLQRNINSILKKTTSVQICSNENNNNSLFYPTFVPSSSSSLKSERNSTVSSNDDSNESSSSSSSSPNEEFNHIVEEFITRLMCKTKGNHSCLLCHKYKNKSFDDAAYSQQQHHPSSLCKNCSTARPQNTTNVKQMTLPSKLRRNVDDRLSFRVTNLTIDDLKTKYHSKNTI